MLCSVISENVLKFRIHKSMYELPKVNKNKMIKRK